MYWAKTLEELEQLGFLYDKEKHVLSCILCKDADYGEFEYAEVVDSGSGDGKMSRKFINLKKSVKRHICQSKSHSNILVEEAKKKAAEDRLKYKNYEAGMSLGRLCMKSYTLGKPYMDYEIDTFLPKKAGANIS